MKFRFKLDNQYNKTMGSYSISFIFTLTTGLIYVRTTEKCLQITHVIISFQYNIPYNIKPVSYFNQQNISGAE